jgi:hypothetical protein
MKLTVGEVWAQIGDTWLECYVAPLSTPISHLDFGGSPRLIKMHSEVAPKFPVLAIYVDYDTLSNFDKLLFCAKSSEHNPHLTFLLAID